MNRALQEKRTLVEMARKFGQEPAPRLLEDLAVLEKDEEERLKREHALRERIAEDLTEFFGKVTPNELVQPSPEPPAETPAHAAITLTEAQADQQLEINIETPRLQDAVADYLRRNVRESTVVNPDPVLARPGKNLEAEVRRLEQWISRIAATGPGGGEVNLRWLDDVDRSNITDGQYLRYDAPTKKFTFDAGDHNKYHLAAQSSETQTSNATSATATTFNITDSNFGIVVDGGSSSQLIISKPGTYNLQFSAQIWNQGNSSDDVYFWLRQNNIDVPGTNGTVTVPAKDNNNSPGKIIAGWNYYVVTTAENEYVQLMWFVDDETHTFMPYIAAQSATALSPAIPATASIIITISPVKINSY